MQTHRVLTDTVGNVLQVERTVAPDPACSVEISTNARGQAVVTVKVYDVDPELAGNKALALYHRLTKAVNPA